MDTSKRAWDSLSKEKRKSSIEEIITFFKEERNEEIGIIAAENILDFFLQNVGKDTYNKGVEDAIAVIKGRLEDVELDLDSLMKI